MSYDFIKKKEYFRTFFVSLIKLNDDNKNISTKIKEIEKIINVPCTLTEFNENTFENFVEKIVVEEVLQNGEKDSNVIRFILKTGSEFKIALKPQDVETQNVSFGSQQRADKTMVSKTW